MSLILIFFLCLFLRSRLFMLTFVFFKMNYPSCRLPSTVLFLSHLNLLLFIFNRLDFLSFFLFTSFYSSGSLRISCYSSSGCIPNWLPPPPPPPLSLSLFFLLFLFHLSFLSSSLLPSFLWKIDLYLIDIYLKKFLLQKHSPIPLIFYLRPNIYSLSPWRRVLYI